MMEGDANISKNEKRKQAPSIKNSSPGLWWYVSSLLRLRWSISWNGLRRAKLSRKIGFAFLGLFLIGLAVGAVILSRSLLMFFKSYQFQDLLIEQQELGDLFYFIESVPVIITSGAFVLLLLTSFGVLLQALYLSGDMDFLLTKPIPIRAVFLSKIIQSILPNFGLVCLLGIPVLFGLGVAWSFHWLYYPFVILVLAALALLASGIASLLVMFVVRLFPARRVAEILGFIGAIASFVCSQSGQLAQFENNQDERAAQAMSLIVQVNQSWSPLSWAGRGLTALGHENWLLAFGLLTLIIGGASIIFLLALTTSEKLYYSGWASMQAVSTKRKKADRARGNQKIQPIIFPQLISSIKAVFQPIADRILPPVIIAVFRKDILVLRRDVKNLSQLVTPLIFGIIYAFVLLRRGDDVFAGRGEAPELIQNGLKALSVYGSVLLALFVSWSLLSRLAGIAFSQEGKNYWIIKSSPVSEGQLVAAKFLVAYIPTLLMSSLFLLAISIIQTNSLRLLPFTLPGVALCIAGNCGINLAFGIAGARMDWQDPCQMQRFWSGCLGALISIVYLPFTMMLFFGPAIAAVVFGFPEFPALLLGLILGGSFSLVMAIFPPVLVRSKVLRLGEG